GANGNTIKPGNTVMVDMNGNFDGYMTDMTRVFALGNVDPLALKAHQCSIDIHRELCAMMRPGAEAKALYAKAEEMVRECGLHPYFMGHRQHAGFIGHGIGIEINELPVIAPRSRDIIAAGNVIALEPKFVIPGTGAVGIENTYAVNDDGIECLTPAPEEISYFDV
ncbi:M24 family metallopeptidase, partial [Duncaniella muris]